MRLVRDEDPVPASPIAGLVTHVPPAAPGPRAAAPILPVLDQLAELQGEVQALQAEVNMLRRRDETLRFYMHRVDEELRLAARIQQDFLPKMLPQLGRVHFHTLFRPAGYVSGDLYDVMRLDEEHIGFFICDAVGHGMPAALLTMFIKRALATKEIFPDRPGYRLLEPCETLERLNHALVEQDLSQATYATALYGVINTRTLDVAYSKGGHPAPALLRVGGELTFPPASGALLGIFPDEKFDVARFRLAPGDRLFVYSDGIEVGFCGENIADSERWQDELRRRHNVPTGQLLLELAEELDKQSGSLQPKDDLTIMAIEVR